jgi:hypothetical protein
MDVNIHTLWLSLDLGPVAFTFRANVERKEGNRNRSKLLKLCKVRPIEILRIWKQNLGHETERESGGGGGGGFTLRTKQLKVIY